MPAITYRYLQILEQREVLSRLKAGCFYRDCSPWRLPRTTALADAAAGLAAFHRDAQLFGCLTEGIRLKQTSAMGIPKFGGLGTSGVEGRHIIQESPSSWSMLLP